MNETSRRPPRRPLRTLALLAVTLVGGVALGRASAPDPEPPHPHEYAPLELLPGTQARRALATARHDFGGPTLQGPALELDSLLRSHRLVLVTWFAEWCANCGYEAPILGDLHRRWRDRGLAVVARSEYSHPDEVRRFLSNHALHVPVIPGSPNPDPEEEDAVRTSTAHYELRRALGDERKWGTPLTLVFAHGGDSAWAVLGELVPEEMEAFVTARLTDPGP